MITNDKYELPVSVAETYTELEGLTGVDKKNIHKSVKTGSTLNKKKWKCVEVEI